jgi:hypothetical protein
MEGVLIMNNLRSFYFNSWAYLAVSEEGRSKKITRRPLDFKSKDNENLTLNKKGKKIEN